MGFKENLKAELAYSGLLVKELAAKTGINKRTIDNYLNSHSCMPSGEAAVKIAAALGVSAEYLFTGREKGAQAASLSREARNLVALFRDLDSGDRRILLTLAKALKERGDAKG
jgi:transcriptional regulator with XRE-family HTH domain